MFRVLYSNIPNKWVKNNDFTWFMLIFANNETGWRGKLFVQEQSWVRLRSLLGLTTKTRWEPWTKIRLEHCLLTNASRVKEQRVYVVRTSWRRKLFVREQRWVWLWSLLGLVTKTIQVWLRSLLKQFENDCGLAQSPRKIASELFDNTPGWNTVILFLFLFCFFCRSFYEDGTWTFDQVNPDAVWYRLAICLFIWLYVYGLTGVCFWGSVVCLRIVLCNEHCPCYSRQVQTGIHTINLGHCPCHIPVICLPLIPASSMTIAAEPQDEG